MRAGMITDLAKIALFLFFKFLHFLYSWCAGNCVSNKSFIGLWTLSKRISLMKFQNNSQNHPASFHVQIHKLFSFIYISHSYLFQNVVNLSFLSCQPMEVSFSEKVFVRSCRCGNDGTMLLTDERSLLACGNNEYNKLGLNQRQGFLMSMKLRFNKVLGHQNYNIAFDSM